MPWLSPFNIKAVLWSNYILHRIVIPKDPKLQSVAGRITIVRCVAATFWAKYLWVLKLYAKCVAATSKIAWLCFTQQRFNLQCTLLKIISNDHPKGWNCFSIYGYYQEAVLSPWQLVTIMIFRFLFRHIKDQCCWRGCV